MAGLADGRRIVCFMATDTDAHRGYARRFRHGFHLSDLAVTRFTFHARVQMLAMSPIHAWKNGINAHPRHLLLRLRKRGQLLDRRFALRDRGMTRHAGSYSREGHQLSWIRVRVARLTIQSQR